MLKTTPKWAIQITWVALLLLPLAALAHNVSGRDASFVEAVKGVQFFPFAYLGAKHMVTGYDHLLYLAGVIFLLHRLKDVAIFASLFALGHTITLLTATLAGIKVNPFLVDAIIGLSVVYKAFENIGGFQSWGWRLSPRTAVFAFGLVHGLGLSSKLQDLKLSQDGLVTNLIGFNLGVEAGQLVALTLMVALFTLWRSSARFEKSIWPANLFLMAAGFLLFAYQLTQYLQST